VQSFSGCSPPAPLSSSDICVPTGISLPSSMDDAICFGGFQDEDRQMSAFLPVWMPIAQSPDQRWYCFVSGCSKRPHGWESEKNAKDHFAIDHLQQRMSCTWSGWYAHFFAPSGPASRTDQTNSTDVVSRKFDMERHVKRKHMGLKEEHRCHNW